MSHIRLYAGLIRNNKWYNYVKLKNLEGGALVLLDTNDNSSTARLINLMRESVDSLYDKDGNKYTMQDDDFLDLNVDDSWKIGYEQIKSTTRQEFPVIEENFLCRRCSTYDVLQYTRVNESWQKLIDKGLIDEVFLDEPKFEFTIKFENPIIIEGVGKIAGGIFEEIVMKYLTLGDMLSLQKDKLANESEANRTYSGWDKSIVKINGIPEKDLNTLKRLPGTFFSKKYLNSTENINAVCEGVHLNRIGVIADDRKIYCKNCNEEIGGSLDYTNFFSPLSPRISTQNGYRNMV
jgi:hypothetical protein